MLKRDKLGEEAVAVTEASFPPGAVIARKIEKEESGARLKMRLKRLKRQLKRHVRIP